ncbi:MAG: hypothetical protein HQM08_27235 [Candidatus Riflebacteria bacterium]|nr:hypothetical protein [Candidatus Riflebacteria bacterium]
MNAQNIVENLISKEFSLWLEDDKLRIKPTPDNETVKNLLLRFRGSFGQHDSRVFDLVCVCANGFSGFVCRWFELWPIWDNALLCILIIPSSSLIANFHQAQNIGIGQIPPVALASALPGKLLE